MLHYNERKFRPGHYKSHAFRDPNSQVSEKKKCHRTYVAFEFCCIPDFFRLFYRKLRFIGLSAKKTYFIINIIIIIIIIINIIIIIITASKFSNLIGHQQP